MVVARNEITWYSKLSSLPLIQGGQLSVSGKRFAQEQLKVVNCLEI